MISIISSLYKSERHLPRFIKRVEKMSAYLGKKGIAHEFIFLPNDPSDEEKKMLEAVKNNGKIKVTPRALETIYASWNEGIRLASYENICFWNADDMRFGKALIGGLDDLRKGADIVYFPLIYFRYLTIGPLKLLAKVKVFYPPHFNKERFMKEMPLGPFFMTTKSAISKLGPFNDAFYVAGDFEWSVRAAMAGARFKMNRTIAGIFTSDGTTLSGSKSDKHAKENEMVLKLSRHD